MRYYNLVVSDPVSGQVWKPSLTGLGFTKSGGGSTFTSYVNGQTLPGALNIEFDLPVVPFNTPQGNAIIRVWGIGLPMIGQAANLNGQNFVLSAGMQKGLPLANPAQAGIIAQGMVFQAFGNWQGVNQTLDLICYPGAANTDQNISFSWAAGTSLATALTVTLAQAFPQYKTSINISSSLTLANAETGHYNSLAQFADYLQQITQKIGMPTNGPQYPGVLITITGNTIFAFDGTSPLKTINLAFQDLIGQPTWIDVATVNFKTVLRSDIAIGNQIKFPLGVTSPYALTTVAAASPNAPASSKTAFQGTFTVTEVHHFANLRQADAESWCTAFSAVTLGTNP